jgi:hypothetical protein
MIPLAAAPSASSSSSAPTKSSDDGGATHLFTADDLDAFVDRKGSPFKINEIEQNSNFVPGDLSLEPESFVAHDFRTFVVYDRDSWSSTFKWTVSDDKAHSTHFWNGIAAVSTNFGIQHLNMADQVVKKSPIADSVFKEGLQKICVMHNGTQIAGTKSENVGLFDLETGRTKSNVPKTYGNGLNMENVPGSDGVVMLLDSQGSLAMYDFKAKKVARKFLGLPTSIYAGSKFSFNITNPNQIIVNTHRQGPVMIYDVGTGKCIAKTEIEDTHATSVTLFSNLVFQAKSFAGGQKVSVSLMEDIDNEILNYTSSGQLLQKVYMTPTAILTLYTQSIQELRKKGK